MKTVWFYTGTHNAAAYGINRCHCGRHSRPRKFLLLGGPRIRNSRCCYTNEALCVKCIRLLPAVDWGIVLMGGVTDKEHRERIARYVRACYKNLEVKGEY